MKRLLAAIGLLAVLGAGYIYVASVPTDPAPADVSAYEAPVVTDSLSAIETDGGFILAQADLSGRNIHPALEIKPTDLILGDVTAPVTLVEYSSLTCPHCARFHNDILPMIEETYIAQGQVRFVMRDLPWDNFGLGMAAVARCAPDGFYYPLVKAFYREQETLMKSADPLQSIQQMAATAGMQPDEVAACVRNEEIQQQILAIKEEALNVLNVKGTPTVFVNGERLESVRTLRQVQDAIELALEQVPQAG